jgi:hypothetical protein
MIRRLRTSSLSTSKGCVSGAGRLPDEYVGDGVGILLASLLTSRRNQCAVDLGYCILIASTGALIGGFEVFRISWAGRWVLVCGVEECCAQCGAGEGEDFDGGREGVALDILRQVENGDVQVMLQSRTRTVLGTQAAREEAAQERWAPCSRQ